VRNRNNSRPPGQVCPLYLQATATPDRAAEPARVAAGVLRSPSRLYCSGNFSKFCFSVVGGCTIPLIFAVDIFEVDDRRVSPSRWSRRSEACRPPSAVRISCSPQGANRPLGMPAELVSKNRMALGSCHAYEREAVILAALADLLFRLLKASEALPARSNGNPTECSRRSQEADSRFPLMLGHAQVGRSSWPTEPRTIPRGRASLVPVRALAS
jgi:hypothetical protein